MKHELLANNTNELEFTREIFPDNYESKLSLLFLVDVSTSMQGEGIKQLNEGLKQFMALMTGDPVAMARLEVGVVSFATKIRLEKSFASIKDSPLPELTAGGRTNMMEAIRVSVQLLHKQKQYYKNMGMQYYRPYIILITDGSPWPNKELGNVPEIIFNGMNKKSFVFQAFGAGKANMRILKQISHPDFPPQKIKGYDFGNFFRWLTPSISTMISHPTIANHCPFLQNRTSLSEGQASKITYHSL